MLVERLGGRMPKVALVLGSGLGDLVDEVEDAISASACRMEAARRGRRTGRGASH